MTNTFDLNEKAYFRLVVDSYTTIVQTTVEQIQIRQDGVDNVIYYKGRDVGWATDPAFGFELADGSTVTQKLFSFKFDPTYFEGILTGSEIVICVDACVDYAGGTRTRMRMLAEVPNLVAEPDPVDLVFIEQPIKINGLSKTYTSKDDDGPPIIEVANPQINVETSMSEDEVNLIILIAIATLTVFLFMLLAYCTYTKLFKDDNSLSKTKLTDRYVVVGGNQNSI